MSAATVELTEGALGEALDSMPANRRADRRPFLIVGSRALLRANRIVRSPGGPLHDTVTIKQDNRFPPDAWELV